jgi:DNA mismatch repair protein MutL
MTITVYDLFADLPARRKFLRARSTEAALCAQVAGHLALGRPDVAFRFISDGRSVFSTAGDGDLRTAALAVRGGSFARGAAELGPLELVDERGAWLGRAHGLLGPTQEQRAARTGLSLYVNRRWVHNRALGHAVEEAYRSYVRTGRHPVAAIFLELPPNQVDVNVHPAKSEVRLLREREIFQRLREAIRQALPPVQQIWDEHEPLAELPGTEAGPARVVGQVGNTYLVVDGAMGLYLVDQHAAHERVLLERLTVSRVGDLDRQTLLAPELVQLSGDFELGPEELASALVELGFEAEPFGPDGLLVRALPAVLAQRNALAGLEEALRSLGGPSGGPSWRERLAVELACKTAVRAGDTLSSEEMAALVAQLGETRLNQTCAHGRPTSILLLHDQLARQFGRM